MLPSRRSGVEPVPCVRLAAIDWDRDPYTLMAVERARAAWPGVTLRTADGRADLPN
jgi:hypothetical protein